MNRIVENLTGMNKLSDQVIAGDLLNAVKTGVRNTAYALTESVTPEVREVLNRQLDEGIAFHERVTSYMIRKGWYEPYDIKEQVSMDISSARNTTQMTQ
ncbi:MAG: spore coat protein [Ignavibacteriales bacterium]